MPITCLPPELLAEIFFRCLMDDEGQAILFEDPHDPPILFTQVCRTWREITLSTPQLWSTLPLPSPPIGTEHVESYISTVAEWLTYSQRLPLTIRVNDLSMPTPYFHSFISVLLKHTSRWERASLDFGGWASGFSIFDGIPEDSFLLLRELEFTTSDGPVPPALAKALRAAQNLRSVRIEHRYILDNAQWTLPWSRLESLSLETRGHPSMLQLRTVIFALKSCVRLRSFTLAPGRPRDVIQVTHVSSKDQVVSLPTLEYLRMPIIPFVMSILDVPNLKRLEFSGNMTQTPEEWGQIFGFAEKFSGSLEQLTASHICSSVPIRRLLSLYPRLKKLGFVNSHLPTCADLFAYLREEVDRQKSLEELIIMYDMMDIDAYMKPTLGRSYIQEIGDILELRWRLSGGPDENGYARIQSLHLAERDVERVEGEDPEVYARLMEFVTKGLNLELA